MKLQKSDYIKLAGIFVATIVIVKILFGNKSNKNWFLTTTKWYNDGQSKKIIDRLHPKFKDKIAEFFTRAEQELGYELLATSGYRTFAEQQALYNQNNSNAKAGYSSHNFGFAVDLNAKKGGKIVLSKSSSNDSWEKSGLVALARKIGIAWVGNFGSYHDPVHFYIQPNGLSTTDLRAMYNAGKKDSAGYVLV
jgi:hypothetical protein